MDAQPVPLPPELSHALAANGGRPLFFEDPATLRTYKLAEAPLPIAVDEKYISQKLDEAIADVEAGRVAPWDVEAFLAEAHRRFAGQNR